jgi:hypothetical protein
MVPAGVLAPSRYTAEERARLQAARERVNWPSRG